MSPRALSAEVLSDPPDSPAFLLNIKYSRFAHQISFHPSLHPCSYYLTGNLPISFVPSRDATSFHTGKHLSLLSGVLLQLLAVFTLKQTPFSRISCFFKHAGLSSILAETLSISSCFSANSKPASCFSG